jgi:hypothetical protein
MVTAQGADRLTKCVMEGARQTGLGRKSACQRDFLYALCAVYGAAARFGQAQL